MSQFHPDVISKQALSVLQQSGPTGKMVVQWSRDDKKVRILGDATEVGGGSVSAEV
jgi:hypothetical protein